MPQPPSVNYRLDLYNSRNSLKQERLWRFFVEESWMIIKSDDHILLCACVAISINDLAVTNPQPFGKHRTQPFAGSYFQLTAL